MGMGYREEDSLEELLERVRCVMLLVASSTECEIRVLSQQLASAIEKRADIGLVNELLDKLDFEVSFLWFD